MPSTGHHIILTLGPAGSGCRCTESGVSADRGDSGLEGTQEWEGLDLNRVALEGDEEKAAA